MVRLKYIDRRKIKFLKLKHYPNGLSLPGPAEINVDESELKNFMLMKNGNNPCFEIIENTEKPRTRKEKVTEE